MTVTKPTQEYQCSFCKRSKYDGDSSCPLDLEGVHGNSDILSGMNRVINSCGCGSFIDRRSHSSLAAEPVRSSGTAMHMTSLPEGFVIRKDTCATCTNTDCEWYNLRDQMTCESREFGKVQRCSPAWVISSVGCASHRSVKGTSGEGERK